MKSVCTRWVVLHSFLSHGTQQVMKNQEREREIGLPEHISGSGPQILMTLRQTPSTTGSRYRDVSIWSDTLVCSWETGLTWGSVCRGPLGWFRQSAVSLSWSTRPYRLCPQGPLGAAEQRVSSSFHWLKRKVLPVFQNRVHSEECDIKVLFHQVLKLTQADTTTRVNRPHLFIFSQRKRFHRPNYTQASHRIDILVHAGYADSSQKRFKQWKSTPHVQREIHAPVTQLTIYF